MYSFFPSQRKYMTLRPVKINKWPNHYLFLKIFEKKNLAPPSSSISWSASPRLQRGFPFFSSLQRFADTSIHTDMPGFRLSLGGSVQLSHKRFSLPSRPAPAFVAALRPKPLFLPYLLLVFIGFIALRCSTPSVNNE